MSVLDTHAAALRRARAERTARDREPALTRVDSRPVGLELSKVCRPEAPAP